MSIDRRGHRTGAVRFYELHVRSDDITRRINELRKWLERRDLLEEDQKKKAA